ncbi:MAG: DUF502 domain-containing protein [Planctomycetota bacterium]
MASTFGDDFKKFFGKGLGILLPTVLTLWILVQLFVFLYDNVGKPINQGVRLAILEITPRVVEDDQLPPWFSVSDEEIAEARSEGLVPDVDGDPEGVAARRTIRAEKFREFWDSHWYLEASGLLVAIVLVYFAGVLLGGFIGRRLYSRIESFLRQLPGFKQIYPHVKQVTELVLGEQAMAFSRAVLVEYPRKGIWTVGLVTSNGLRTVEKAAEGEDVMTVFIPSTPTPFTGFTINVRTSDAIDLPVPIDEAIRYFITGGVLIPGSEARPSLESPSDSVDGASEPVQRADSRPDPEAAARQIRARVEDADRAGDTGAA